MKITQQERDAFLMSFMESAPNKTRNKKEIRRLLEWLEDTEVRCNMVNAVINGSHSADEVMAMAK